MVAQKEMQQQSENNEERVNNINSSILMLTNQNSSFRKMINESNESMRNDIIIDSGASKSYFNSTRRLRNLK
jgi:6-phosphogluconate dehydrogenase